MDEREFSEAVTLLSGEHGVAILRRLSDGGWRIASDVSRELHIHTTTASKFLAGMHRLGFLERRVRKARTRSAFEYRLSAPRVALTLDLEQGPEPLRAALDFYLDYVSNVLEKARRIGWPGVEERLSARLEKGRNGLKEHLFTRILDGGRSARGMEDLKTLFGDIYAEFLQITTETVGEATARRLLAGAAEEARRGREDLVDRHRLREPLGVHA